jgi:SAM-dependent methyltransferase
MRKLLRRNPSAATGDGFSPDIYREFNLDLRHLSDDQLAAHFAACQHEPRIFGPTKTTAEFLSMRWLRGAGLEVGAGGHPTKIFGATKTLQADVDIGLPDRGEKVDVQVSVDDPVFPSLFKSPFDFSIASHVLEHCDSFIRAVENLIAVVREDGIVYMVLPDIEFLSDQNWISYFDFAHHVQEYENPLLNCGVHDDTYIRARVGGIASTDRFADLPLEYQEMLRAGKIAAEFRFLHHKHNYTFGGWLEMIEETRKFLNRGFEILDSRYGHERKDCHFVLRRKAGHLKIDD